MISIVGLSAGLGLLPALPALALFAMAGLTPGLPPDLPGLQALALMLSGF